MNTENFSEILFDLNGTKVRLTTYKIGEEHYCHVYNVDPGSVISRASSNNRERAKEEALNKAKQRLFKKADYH